MHLNIATYSMTQFKSKGLIFKLIEDPKFVSFFRIIMQYRSVDFSSSFWLKGKSRKRSHTSSTKSVFS